MFLPPLLRQLKSAKEDVRANAVTAVESLALRCKDIEVRAPTCISSILLLQSQPHLNAATNTWSQLRVSLYILYNTVLCTNISVSLRML
jgi:hypothetical protein